MAYNLSILDFKELQYKAKAANIEAYNLSILDFKVKTNRQKDVHLSNL